MATMTRDNHIHVGWLATLLLLLASRATTSIVPPSKQ